MGLRRRRTTSLGLVGLAGAASLSLLAAPAPTAVFAAGAATACPPGYAWDAGGGLDGAGGCHALAGLESPTELLAKVEQADQRHALDSGDRYQAGLAHAKVLAAGPRRDGDFVTAAGATVTGSGGAWKPAYDGTINVTDPQYDPTQLGWTTLSGRATSLAVDPTDASGNTMYAGFAAGGVWKTTDAGKSWTDVTRNLPTTAVGAVTVAPNGTLFVGTGEGNTNSDAYLGAGVFRSTDGGATYTRGEGIPYGLVIPHVAVAGQRVYVATNMGLYGSTDGGATYSLLTLPTGATDKALGVFVTDVRVKPGTENMIGGPEVTAAVGWRSGGVSGAGLYRSTGGSAFTQIAGNGAPATSGIGFGKGDSTPQTGGEVGRISLAYADGPSQDHNILWAVVEDPGRLNNDLTPIAGTAPMAVPPTNLNGVYRSGDDGATWAFKGGYPTYETAPNSAIAVLGTSLYGPGIQSWYNQYVVVDPTNSDHVIVGLEEILQTIDGNSTANWTVVGRYWNNCGGLIATQSVQCPPEQAAFGDKTTHPDQHAGVFAALPGGGSRFYAGNDGGVYTQVTDPVAGVQQSKWQSINNALLTAQPYEAVMSGDGTIYSGLQDNGTIKITPQGRADMVYGGDGFRVAVEPDNSANAYEEYANGAIRKTTNGGQTWTLITPSGATGQRFDTPFVMDRGDKNHLVYGAGQVYETTKGTATTSSTWTKVFTLPTGAGTTALANSGATSYAAYCVGGCNITTANGTYDPSLFNGGIATNAKPGCTATVAGTDCWHVAAANGLPKQLVLGLSIDPSDPNTVYAAVTSYSRHWTVTPSTLTAGHLFKSTDGGENFTDVSGNLPDVLASDVIVTADKVIVGNDVGVFAAPKGTTDYVPFGTGLPVVPAYQMTLNPDGSKLVLATHGRGIWVLDSAASAPSPVVPEVPVAILLPLAALLIGGVAVGIRRRRI